MGCRESSGKEQIMALTADEVLKGFTAFDSEDIPFITLRKTTITLSVTALNALGNPTHIQLYTKGNTAAFRSESGGQKLSYVNNRACRITNGRGYITKLMDMATERLAGRVVDIKKDTRTRTMER